MHNFLIKNDLVTRKLINRYILKIAQNIVSKMYTNKVAIDVF